MGKIVLICRDALENSVIGNVGVAMEAKKEGDDVAIIFTQEALAALSGSVFDWSPLLRPREKRSRISKSAEARGITVSSPKDARWTDMGRLIQGAKDAGISLYACPLWSELLGVQGKLPAELAQIDLPTAMKALKEADVVIGSF